MDINLICIIVIISVFVIELCLVIAFKVNHKIITYKRIVDYFPTSLSTMGVLGTFIGIYIGLQEFDPRNIQASIPVLLDGLKTAFSTSLWGMGLSLGFSFLINLLTDLDEEKNPTEVDKLAVKISEAVDKMCANVVGSMERVRQQIDRQTQIIQTNHADTATTAKEITRLRTKVDTDLTKLLSTLIELKKWFQEDYQEKFSELATDVSVSRLKLSKSEEYLDNISDEETNRNKLFADMLQASIKDVQSKMMECNKIFQEKLLEGEKLLQSNITNGQEASQRILETCNQQISEKLAECDAMVMQRITECSLLLDTKLDVFGQSIAKSNTEALSCVMETACMSFQSTMNGMIGQLVKENFAELNTNVKTLNQWQVSNMHMVGDLLNRSTAIIEQMDQSAQNVTLTLKKNVDGLVTELVDFSKEITSGITTKYTKMLDDMSRSTQVLEKVAEYTQAINGAEGELGNLVKALQSVVINDQSFVNVSRNLTASIAKNADTVEQINNISLTLKTWMNNNSDMTYRLNQLIAKLDELNKMRDFNNVFWASAKAQLEDGIRVLKSGTVELNKQLNNIDQHFYERLSVTMANLDECLSKIVESKDR